MRLGLVLPVLLTALAAAPSAQEASRPAQRPQQERAAPGVQRTRSAAPAAERGQQAQPKRRSVGEVDLSDPKARAQYASDLDAKIAQLKARQARAEAAGKPIAPERIAHHMEVLRQLEGERAKLAEPQPQPARGR
jgi:hypothetical protein